MLPKGYENLKIINEPHVVILGAGASCAAAAAGAEKNNRKLPTMNQLPRILDLDDILTDDQILEAENDFESFYDKLLIANNSEITSEIEGRLYAYFDSLELSEELTLYDKLILSLRKKDLIASFNWDPLLGYAYGRNGKLMTLPHLVFLHGNVLQGLCQKGNSLGWKTIPCDICGGRFSEVPLLYPVSNKDYTTDPVLVESWKILDFYLSVAYFITIFGYSAPYTDRGARERIVNEIQENQKLRLLQLEIINLDAENLSKGNLKEIISGTHCSLGHSFEESWLNLHPRFTCEALYQATMMQNPLLPIGFPDEEDLISYQKWAYDLNNGFPEFMKEGYPNQG